MTDPRPRAGLPAGYSRRQEALQRLMTVLEVNKDRIPREVVEALISAWKEYIDAFGEQLIASMKQLVENVESLRKEEPEDRAR